jgi:HsdM N-terminal domain
MAIKKSELYSSLWASCDELRGGMDASQYKDYVLFMLFIATSWFMLDPKKIHRSQADLPRLSIFSSIGPPLIRSIPPGGSVTPSRIA